MSSSNNETDRWYPDLREWTFVKERGALTKTGKVYRSADNQTFLRTGPYENIRAEAAFAREMRERGFPVPEVTAVGVLPDETGYFAEMSVGERNFGDQLRAEYENAQAVSEATFRRYQNVVLSFLEAQIQPRNRSTSASQLKDGIQLKNVLEQNPDIPPTLLNRAVARAEDRLRDLPLVLTHGDLTPFNVMDRGVIDFEHRFTAPFGYDAVTAVTFQRFWDHPRPDQTGTMKRWEWTPNQLTEYLARVDALCAAASVPAVSAYFDDFLLLKAIWALSYEKTNDPQSPQARRWLWRKRVVLYCAERYLAGEPVDSMAFHAVGLGLGAG